MTESIVRRGGEEESTSLLLSGDADGDDENGDIEDSSVMFIMLDGVEDEPTSAAQNTNHVWEERRRESKVQLRF